MKYLGLSLCLFIASCSYTHVELRPIKAITMSTPEIVEWTKEYQPEHYKKYEEAFEHQLDTFYLRRFMAHLAVGMPIDLALDMLKLARPKLYDLNKEKFEKLREKQTPEPQTVPDSKRA